MKHFLILASCLLIVFVSSCSKETDSTTLKKTRSYDLSEKQKYYLLDPNRLTKRVANRKALWVTTTEPNRRNYWDCSQPGTTCDIGAKSMTGSKANLINWLDNQVPNVTSQMLKDSIMTDTTWNVYFPQLFYPNIKNAISNDTLRLSYDGVDLEVIDNYTEELIFNHKWADTWNLGGGPAPPTRKGDYDPGTKILDCKQIGNNCKVSVGYTNYTNLIGLFDTIFPGVDFAYYVENELYECLIDTFGGLRFKVYNTISGNDFYVIHNNE